MPRFRLAPLVIGWYLASVCAVTTCKHLLNETGAPASLTALQFLFAVFSVSVFRARSLAGASEMWKSRSRRRAAETLPPTMHGIVLSYALGFLITNAAFSYAAAAFVETLKSAEPLSTVALAALLLGERETAKAYLALIPIVVGVALASTPPGFDLAGFSVGAMLLALASNVSFSTRAVLVKRLKARFPNHDVAVSDAALFYHVNRLGLWLLLPAALLLDARAMIAALRAAPHLLAPLLANCAAHATYNALSFVVLGRVSVASHAVLNIVRRVLVIGVAAVLFATPFAALNAAGLALCVGGLLLYAREKKGRTSPDLDSTRVVLPL